MYPTASISGTNTTSRVQNNITSNGIFNLAIETNLNYSTTALYGTDTIALSYPSSSLPSLTHQVLGGVASNNFFLGVFGLNPATSNFSSFNDPVPSYMSNLRTQNLIPSLSYAYTAGAPYRSNGVLGSLTLGGYDASLTTANSTTFAFAPDVSRDLVVNIHAISSDTQAAPLNAPPTSWPAFIDSTVPFLYLPPSACSAFESAFSLADAYDAATNMYLVNDTLHQHLLDMSPNITFTLSNSSSNFAPSNLVNITLPYAAFDLLASAPLVKNSTRYFPLRKAQDNTQTTLGRAFLQEAYLIADYERSSFSISQRLWSDASSKSDIRTISPPTAPGNGSSNTNATSTTQKGQTTAHWKLPLAAIVALAVGGTILLTLLAGGTILFRQRKRLSQQRGAPQTQASPAPTYDEGPFKPELDASAIPRMSTLLKHYKLAHPPELPATPWSASAGGVGRAVANAGAKLGLGMGIPPPPPRNTLLVHELPAGPSIHELPASFQFPPAELPPRSPVAFASPPRVVPRSYYGREEEEVVSPIDVHRERDLLPPSPIPRSLRAERRGLKVYRKGAVGLGLERL